MTVLASKTFMDQSTVLLIADIILLIVGIYLIANSRKTKETGKVSEVILPPEDQKMIKSMKDFAVFIAGREIVLAIVCIAYGVIGLLIRFTALPYVIHFATLVILLLAFLWFTNEVQSGKRKY